MLEYATDLFDRASVEALAGAAGAAAGGGGCGTRPRDRQPRHSRRRRSATPSCATWNDTAHADRRPRPCRSCSPRRWRARPMRSRWCSRSSSLSYGELDARANQLAHHLRALGVGPEVVVGLCVERSLEMVVGLLGILKAGGAYLPLDPGLPGRAPRLHAGRCRRAACWSPSRRCSTGCRASRRPHRAARCRLARHRARSPPRAPPIALDPHNTAYVIYTSGSTGTPKGRRRSRIGGLVNYIAWADPGLSTGLGDEPPADHTAQRSMPRSASSCCRCSSGKLVVAAARQTARARDLAAPIRRSRRHRCCSLRRSLDLQAVGRRSKRACAAIRLHR